MLRIVKSIVVTFKNHLLKSEFLRNVSLLAGSTIVAQAIALAAIPIITRIYTPEEYGIYGAYLSMLSIILVVASLRYELAISLPHDDETAANLMGLSLIIVAVMSIFTVVVIIFFWPAILGWTHTPGLKNYLWFLPVTVLGAGSYQVISFWSVRKKTFNVLAKTKLRQSIGKALTQVGLGFSGFGVFGLLIGQIIGDTAGSGTLLADAIKRNKQELRKISFAGLISVARTYWRFPVYSTPGKMLSVATTQIPLLCILAFYGTKNAGWYSLVQLVLGAPTLLVIISVQNVFWSEASCLILDDPIKLRKLFYKITRVLLLAGLGFGLVAFFSPWLFPVFFGQSWLEAGIYARNMEFMFITQIIIMPLSILAVFQLQHWETGWNFLCFIITVVCFGVGIKLNIVLAELLMIYAFLIGACNILLYGLNAFAIKQKASIYYEKK